MKTRVKVRESLKFGARRALLRANLDVGRDPASARLVRMLSSRRIETILDVGANMGQFARLTRSSGYRGRIYSFEPLPDAYDVLHSLTQSDPGWISRNVAVGGESGVLRLNIAGNSFSSSVLPMAASHLEVAPNSAYVGQVEVPSTTVARILVDEDVDASRTLLKVDTQGYELPVLQGAGEQLSSFAAIQVEMSFVSLYEGQILFDPLRELIESAGFELFSLEPGIAATDGRLLQVDGLFVRS